MVLVRQANEMGRRAACLPIEPQHRAGRRGGVAEAGRRLPFIERQRMNEGRERGEMETKNTQVENWENILAALPGGKVGVNYATNRKIFTQGQPADAVYYIRRGKVRMTVTSKPGKEAIVAVLGPGELFGEGCLVNQPLRIATATAMTECTLTRIERKMMARMLHDQHEVSELFVAHLLSRNIRFEADLVDQLFNSSEKRLARILLLLAHFGKESRSETVLPKITQEHLAQMVGTTRSRVSFFMSKFKKLGFIDTVDGLTVHNGLLNVVLHD